MYFYINTNSSAHIFSSFNGKSGGRTGIRTQERVAPLPVFKTGAFNRSAILPNKQYQTLFNNDYKLKNNRKLKTKLEFRRLFLH